MRVAAGRLRQSGPLPGLRHSRRVTALVMKWWLPAKVRNPTMKGDVSAETPVASARDEDGEPCPAESRRLLSHGSSTLGGARQARHQSGSYVAHSLPERLDSENHG